MYKEILGDYPHYRCEECLVPLNFTPEDYNSDYYNKGIMELEWGGGKILPKWSSSLEDDNFYHIFVGHDIFTDEGEARFANFLHDLVGHAKDALEMNRVRYLYQIYFLTGLIQKKATEILYREFPVPEKKYERRGFYIKEAYVPSWAGPHFVIKHCSFYTMIFILDYRLMDEYYKNNRELDEGHRYKLYIGDADDTFIEWETDDVNVLLNAYEILIDPTIILLDAMELCESILPPESYANAYP